MFLTAAFTMVLLTVVITRIHRRATVVQQTAVPHEGAAAMPSAADYLRPLMPPAAETGSSLAAVLSAAPAAPAAKRVYREFRLGPSPQATFLDGIALRMAHADPPRRQFTLVIQAAGREAVEPQRRVDEKIRFYVAWSPQPYEVVINELSENGASGRLWEPDLSSGKQ